MNSFEARKSFEHIDKLSYEIGPRVAGTDRSEKTSEYLKKKFEGYGLETSFQEFNFVNAVTKNKIRSIILIATLVISFLLNFYLNPIISVIVAVAGIAIAFQVQRFLPKEKDRNVIGILEPEKEIRRRILVGAHYDSAVCIRDRNWSSLFKIGLRIVLAIFVGSLILTTLIEWMIWPYGVIAVAAPYIFISSIPLWIYKDLNSPGADDNGSGISVMLEVARIIAESPPDKSKIIFVAFGGEEQGLKGSKAFSEKMPTLDSFLNIDSVGSGDSLCTIRGNGIIRRTRTSSQLNSELNEKGGVESVWTPFAGHDHIPLLKKGVDSTTLSSFETGSKGSLDGILEKIFGLQNVRSNRLSRIHSEKDIPDVIKLENIKKSGEIILETLRGNVEK